MANMNDSFIQFFKRFTQIEIHKVRSFLWYGNIVIFAFMLVWLYLFVDAFFLKSREDISFMKENITTVSQVKLNRTGFEEMYTRHQNKIKSEIPEGVESPF